MALADERICGLMEELAAAHVRVRDLETEREGLDHFRQKADARIAELERELTAANTALEVAGQELRRRPHEPDPLYRRVGLDRDCPDFVSKAARRAYRVTLHETSTLPSTNASRTRSWSPPSRFSILCSRDAGSAHEVVPDRLGLARLGAVLPHAVSGSRRAGHLRARLLRLKGAPITRRIRAPERWPVWSWVLRLGSYCITTAEAEHSRSPVLARAAPSQVADIACSTSEDTENCSEFM